MAIGVGLHNIPFGIEIAATLNETKKNKASVILNIILPDDSYMLQMPFMCLNLLIVVVMWNQNTVLSS